MDRRDIATNSAPCAHMHITRALVAHIDRVKPVAVTAGDDSRKNEQGHDERTQRGKQLDAGHRDKAGRALRLSGCAVDSRHTPRLRCRVTRAPRCHGDTLMARWTLGVPPRTPEISADRCAAVGVAT